MRQNIIFETKKEVVEARPKEFQVDPEPKRFRPEFKGQQEDELILYHTKPHSSMKYLNIGLVIAGGLFLVFLLQLFVAFVPAALSGLENLAVVVVASVIAIIVWWINETYKRTDLYITDRRIVKFSPTVPYRRTMRTIFWDDAIKAKTFYQNAILGAILGVGSVEVEGRHESDNIIMDNISYHEDLGHYIDKILFVYKNKPGDLRDFKKFIPKPAGKRD